MRAPGASGSPGGSGQHGGSSSQNRPAPRPILPRRSTSRQPSAPPVQQPKKFQVWMCPYGCDDYYFDAEVLKTHVNAVSDTYLVPKRVDGRAATNFGIFSCTMLL